MSIIDEVKNFVKSECRKPNSKYGYEPFEYHFTPAVKYAEELADKLDVDKEVVILATWLHDIGSIIEGRKDHHISGAKIAEKKLKELDYPSDKIKIIKRCILNHRGSQENNRNSIEEKIVSEADTMSNFNNISGIFKAAFIYEGKTQGEARKSVREKLERKWKQLHFKKSKKIIKPKYEAVMLLLK